MRSTRRSSLLGTTIIICIIILIVSMSFKIIDMRDKNIELENNINISNTTINDQSEVIEELQSNNTNLTTQILQLKDIIASLEKDKLFLQAEVNKETVLVQVDNKDFKSYMPYTTITDKSSKQWALQQSAYTNGEGIRCINGIPLVAVGTGWGLAVGDVALVTCENGNSFMVMVGDIKADIHTQADNKTTILNNCRCEFIVDANKLNQYIKRTGNMAALKEYSGYVVNIEKVEK